MIYYVYDGTFEGFLSAVTELFRSEREGSVSKEEDIRPLIPHIEAEVIEGITEKFGEYLSRHFGRAMPETIYYAFLSELPGIEEAIIGYIRLARKIRKDPIDMLNVECVRRVAEAYKRIGREKHRYMGLLRFRCIGENLYYAAIRPDNFILPILAPFFVERFADQRWIIHDRQRGLAAVYNLKTWAMIERDTADLPSDSPTEDAAQHLWQCFFDSIAVRERLNLALQQKCIPKKYWQDLIEKPGR